tara:strand:- start:1060 stop:1737 length:678 start_codon:yes stop_codon:yes gene_type:complete
MTQSPKHQATQEKTADNDGLDATSLAAIRSLLVAEPEAFKATAPTKPGRHRKTPPARTAEPARTATDEPGTRIQAAPAQAENEPFQAERPATARSRIAGFRPSAKHILLGGIVVLIVFRPWLILGLLALSTFVMVGVFLILGYDGFWRRAMAVARWYARRRPSRAAALHSKLDRFAMKWDGVLDRFPEGTVDGLYLPDFGYLAEADARHDAALDRRFEKLRGTEG